MAVIVKYIVVRNGVEKMTFATKKEADAHDKMLDIADNLYTFFKNEKLELNDDQLEGVALFIAEKREELMPILRGVSPTAAKTSADGATTSSAGTRKPTAKKPSPTPKKAKKEEPAA